MDMRVSGFASVLVMGLLSSTACASIVAFSNFTTGNGYDTTSAWGVSYRDYQSLAMPFTSDVTGNVERYTLAVRGNKEFTLQLYQDDGGLPGTVLETLTTPVPASSTDPGLMEVLSVGNPHLVAGNTYWVGLLPVTGGSGAWMLNTQNGFGMADQRELNGTWNAFFEPQSAFRVEVPEPATAGVFAISFLGLLGHRWRRA